MDTPLDHYGSFINGEFTDIGIGEIEVTNPGTGGTTTSLTEAGRPGVVAAVKSAESAAGDWADVEPAERGELLRSVAELLRENNERLAKLKTLENGAPHSDALQLVEGAAKYFDYYAGLTDKIEGETIPVPGNRLDYTQREPLGVTGHIIPWNAPLTLCARSIAPALACGNTVVAKPSPLAPITVLEAARYASMAGIPDGVFNVVPGEGKRTGEPLTEDNRVAKYVFTGSVDSGIKVMKSAAENVVPVTAELGGKNPAIVFPDANLEKAADDLTKAFWLAGQVCFAPTKIFIHDDVYDEFQRALIERAEGLTVGPGEEDPDVGPVISANAVDRIEEYVSEAAKSGATVHTGGEQIQGSGHFFAPTLIDGVSDDAPISCEEVFGPVVATYRFENETEAVKRANNTKYGLYGVVWTDNLARAHRVAGDLEAGSIAVNEYPATFPQAPFGGYKKSGIGREKGQQAVEHFTQIKNVTISLE